MSQDEDELFESLRDDDDFWRLQGRGDPSGSPGGAPEVGLARSGQRVGEWLLVRRLGEGGFGEVWLALHAAIAGRRAAIKLPRGEEGAVRLRRDGIAQARLDTPEIVRVLGMNPDHDPPYVAYEPILGGTLAGRLPLPFPRALDLIVSVATALAHAHVRGVLHLDLKPANVLLDPAGGAHLTDFGFDTDAEVVAVDDALHLSTGLRSAPLAGTVAYMAPEQRLPGPIDARADVYAFGVLLFEVLTGRLPTGLERPGEVVRNLPPALDALYERCCAPLERRPADGTALLIAVGEAARAALREIVKWRERVHS